MRVIATYLAFSVGQQFKGWGSSRVSVFAAVTVAGVGKSGVVYGHPADGDARLSSARDLVVPGAHQQLARRGAWASAQLLSDQLIGRAAL